MIGTYPNCFNDRDAVAGVFFSAVREGTVCHASVHQRYDWGKTACVELPYPATRFAQVTSAKEEKGQIIMFKALDKSDCLDTKYEMPTVMAKAQTAVLCEESLADIRAAELNLQTSLFSSRFPEKRGRQGDGIDDFNSSARLRFGRFLASVDLAPVIR